MKGIKRYINDFLSKQNGLVDQTATDLIQPGSQPARYFQDPSSSLYFHSRVFPADLDVDGYGYGGDRFYSFGSRAVLVPGSQRFAVYYRIFLYIID